MDGYAGVWHYYYHDGVTRRSTLSKLQCSQHFLGKTRKAPCHQQWLIPSSVIPSHEMIKAATGPSQAAVQQLQPAQYRYPIHKRTRPEQGHKA